MSTKSHFHALQEEEERYLSAAGAGVLEQTGKLSKTSLLAGTGQNILGSTAYGAGKTIGSIQNG